MKLHILKLEKTFLNAVMWGDKKAELRKDDRNYKVGDLIHFVDVDGREFEVYGNNLFRITHILRNAALYGALNGYAMLSIVALN